MNGPSRLRDGDGSAGRLLRAAELDAPSAGSRRRAVAFASAATTLAAASTSAAAAGGTLLKAALIWFCAGAAGGIVTAFSATELTKPSAAPAHADVASRPSTTATVRAPSAPSAPGASQAPAPGLEEPSAASGVNAPADTLPAPMPVARAAAPAEPAPYPPQPVAHEPAQPAASVAAFADSHKPALSEELRQIEAARAALGRGELGAALGILDRYDRNPAGSFHPESLALRIQALSQSGNQPRARSLAAEFKRLYPQHPLLAHVRAAIGE